MDIFAKPSKNFVSLSSMEKKLIHPKRGWCESFDSANHFPDDKKNHISRKRFCFARACWNFRFFNPIWLTTSSIFFRLESADSTAEKTFICLESVALMVISKSDFRRFLVFSMRFIKNGLKKKKKKKKPQSLLTDKF